jgi:pimeloyl-ACP methyl ester carboxylesterase
MALGAMLALCGAVVAAQAAPEAPSSLTLAQLRAKYAEPGAAYMTLHGVEVYYKDEGAGPAILMIHGSSSTLKTYDRIAEDLKGRYRVIRYDVPPQGLSGSVPDVVAASGVKAEDLPVELLTRLGVKSATVVGVSSGGTIGYFMASRYPRMVDRLILANTPADPLDTSHLKLSRRMIEEQAAQGESGYAANAPVSGKFKRRSYWDAFFEFFAGEPERITPDIREQYYDVGRRVPEANMLAFTAVVADHAATVALAAKVTCPVLLVWGERDPLLTASAAGALAGYLKNADVSTLMLPDVGHYPPLEIPDRYAQIIAAYIEAVTPVKPKSPPPADR